MVTVGCQILQLNKVNCGTSYFMNAIKRVEIFLSTSVANVLEPEHTNQKGFLLNCNY